MLFDTHAHFNFNAFKDDWKEVIERTLKQNVWLVNVGAEAKTSRRAVEIAGKYPKGIYAAVGLHPIHTYDDKFEEIVKGEKVEFVTKAEEFDKQYYASLIENNQKVVTVGETGLDYFHIKKFPVKLNKKLKNKQAEIFVEQIKLANEFKKPIIIHCRPDKDYDAYKDILAIVSEYNKPPLFPLLRKKGMKGYGIVHCFQANPKILGQFLDLGFMIGYNGVITFTSDYDGLVKATPLERIVLETDAPYLAPVPHRGKRNESTYVEYVAKRIAEIKGMEYDKVAKVTTDNAMRVFNIQISKSNTNNQ